MRRIFSPFALSALIALVALMLSANVRAATVTGAAFTTTNTTVDGDGHCKNGNPGVNCNIYDGKRYVWLNGGPSTAYVGDGDYFFAVLVPGGQPDPNDASTVPDNGTGTAKNLSDDFDTYAARTFSVRNGALSYSGGHTFANNKIRLMPYADTTNPGGVYIMAICSLDKGYPVDPSRCKYDAFKVSATTVPNATPLTVTKDAAGAYTNTYGWTISKSVDKTVVKQAAGNATFQYTVTVTPDRGTISGVQVTGTISVFNPNVDVNDQTVAVTGVDVTDTLSNDTSCVVDNGTGQTLTTAKTAFTYTCNISGLPQGRLDNTVSVSWPAQFLDNGSYLASGNDTFTFNSIAFAPAAESNKCVTATDTFDGGTANTLGVVCADGTSTPDAGFKPTITYDSVAHSFAITYSRSVDVPRGTCRSYDNTAAIQETRQASNTVTVKVCGPVDLGVGTTAAPKFTRTYNWSIKKAVDKTEQKLYNGSATFNYTVNAAETGFGDGGWQVAGTITVSNPNDWLDFTGVDVVDAVDNGGSCVVTNGTNLTVPKAGSVTRSYTCTYTTAPTAKNGTNTAIVSWDPTQFSTPDSSAQGTASFTFDDGTAGNPTEVDKTVTVQDTFNGGTPTTLGALTGTTMTPYASGQYKYPRTVPVPPYGCRAYTNTATIVETGQTAGQTVSACRIPLPSGALTMGFWQNKNGQGIITGQAKTGTCPSGTWLRQYAPFQDLSSTASCSQVAGYVYNVIKSANASGASMNAMLKAQMLATSLDVYFSDPALGGNKIGAYNGLGTKQQPIGGLSIDLTQICKMANSTTGTATCSATYSNVSSAFGGAPSMTVSQMLAYVASRSNAGGSAWYANVKSIQELAKNAFDAINNQVAFAP